MGVLVWRRCLGMGGWVGGWVGGGEGAGLALL